MAGQAGEQLELRTITSQSLDDIEMGILEDGTSYLTGRGLARVCGVVPSVINQWANEFDPHSGKPRDTAIARLLQAQGYRGSAPFIKTDMAGAGRVNAYPEQVCMAVLEYYAFEAGWQGSDVAQRSYRLLARAGLRAYVYSQLGFDPSRGTTFDAFRSYHDRLLLNRMPSGFFSAFSETSHIVLASIRDGLLVDSHTVPDISVGKVWSKHWEANRLAEQFGERMKYPHQYPEDYPQSAANPEAWIYPMAALGEFRVWLDQEYLPQKYPAYIRRKVKQGALPPSRAEMLLAAVQPAALPSPQGAR